jgi:hypothetical protein
VEDGSEGGPRDRFPQYSVGLGEDERRPLVFIGHSLGGLLIKEV